MYNNRKEFYGAIPKNFGVQINAERSAYVAEWYTPRVRQTPLAPRKTTVSSTGLR